jgi:ribosomal protein L12E/L44/L45/RPP1/RPP2
MSCRIAMATQRNPVSKNKNKNKTKKEEEEEKEEDEEEEKLYFILFLNEIIYLFYMSTL